MVFNNVLSSFVIIAFAALAACSPSRSSSKATIELVSRSQNLTVGIVGGTVVDGSDPISKMTVAVFVSTMDQNHKPTQFICGGVLIAEHAVLTAAHCLQSPGESQVYIIFSSDLSQVDREDVQLASEQIVHPQFGEHGPHGEDLNDLAVLKFSGPLPSKYREALLADEASTSAAKVLTIAGYGVTDGTETSTDGKLRRVDVSKGKPFGETEMILDQSAGKGACQGDSGGPVFVQINGSFYLWGITSRGAGAANDCRSSGIYTKVSTQMNFINAALRRSK